MYDCGVHKNHSLALLIANLAFFVTIGSDTMRLLQEKIPVIVQSTQPKRWTKQQLQQSVANRHVIHNTVLRGHLLHRISPIITTFILLVSNLHSNANEPYSCVVHPTDDDRSKANQDDSRLDSTNGSQVVASSGGDGGDDDDEDHPRKRRLHNNGCGGDESPAGRNENDQDDDHDHDNENGFPEEQVDAFGSDNPDDFPDIVLDGDTDIVEDDIVEIGVVEEEYDEDMVGLWQE